MYCFALFTRSHTLVCGMPTLSHLRFPSASAMHVSNSEDAPSVADESLNAVIDIGTILPYGLATFSFAYLLSEEAAYAFESKSTAITIHAPKNLISGAVLHYIGTNLLEVSQKCLSGHCLLRYCTSGARTLHSWWQLLCPTSRPIIVKERASTNDTIHATTACI